MILNITKAHRRGATIPAISLHHAQAAITATFNAAQSATALMFSRSFSSSAGAEVSRGRRMRALFGGTPCRGARAFIARAAEADTPRPMPRYCSIS